MWLIQDGASRSATTLKKLNTPLGKSIQYPKPSNMPPLTPAKPWSVAVFQTQRPEMTAFVNDKILPLLEDDECRRIVVRAPVKSGKREMVEYIAMRDVSEQPVRAHAFLSAWHRVADDTQREELLHQNMAVFSVTNQTNLTRCLAWIEAQLAKGLQVVLHLDECDYGSGSKQVLAKMWAEVRNNPRITNLLYSATPEEVLYSGEVENAEIETLMADMLGGHHVRYTPPKGYCGPARFLKENLVHVALPFFQKTGAGYSLSSQGKEIVSDLRSSMETKPKRNVIVLRLCGGEGGNQREHKAIHQFLGAIHSFPELAGFDVVADIAEGKAEAKEEAGVTIIKQTVCWSDSVYWRRSMPEGTPTIIVVDQKSTRSTEWVCHDRIFAEHDFRASVRFSTVSQAVERVNHYEQKYATPEKKAGEFQRIRVYCHTKTLRLSAGEISYEEFMTDLWESRKVDARSTGGAEVYWIRSKATKEPHPKYTTPVDVATRDRVMQELECGATTTLSNRVEGKVVEMRVYDTQFHPVTDTTKEGWAAFTTNLRLGRAMTRSFNNPFPLSTSKGLEGGRYKGRLACRRGEELWRVLEFDRDVKTRASWGHTEVVGGFDQDQRVICYRDGVLGIAVRVDTGDKAQMNTLKAFRSMYGPQKPPIKLKKQGGGGSSE